MSKSLSKRKRIDKTNNDAFDNISDTKRDVSIQELRNNLTESDPEHVQNPKKPKSLK